MYICKGKGKGKGKGKSKDRGKDKSKGKDKVQPRTDHERSTLSSTSALGVVGGQRLAWAARNDPVPIGSGADLDRCLKFRPYRNSIP